MSDNSYTYSYVFGGQKRAFVVKVHAKIVTVTLENVSLENVTWNCSSTYSRLWTVSRKNNTLEFRLRPAWVGTYKRFYSDLRPCALRYVGHQLKSLGRYHRRVLQLAQPMLSELAWADAPTFEEALEGLQEYRKSRDSRRSSLLTEAHDLQILGEYAQEGALELRAIVNKDKQKT